MNVRDYNVKTSAPKEDRLEITAHFKGDIFPRKFVIKRLDREVDYVTVDGERYERVSERAAEWDGQWFRCGACGERLSRFGVRTTSMLDGTMVRTFAEPPNYCPHCGARVKEVGA